MCPISYCYVLRTQFSNKQCIDKFKFTKVTYTVHLNIKYLNQDLYQGKITISEEKQRKLFKLNTFYIILKTNNPKTLYLPKVFL